MTEPTHTPQDVVAALIHETLGTEPSRINLKVMDDRLRATVPVRSYSVSGIIVLARRTGRMYQVSETANTGTIDFMDNPERAEREGRAPHRGEEILARIADYLTRQPEVTEAEKPDKPTPPPTFAERIASSPPEQLELIPGVESCCL